MADLAGVDQADDLRAAEAQDLELGDQRAARRPGPSSSSSSATCSAERRHGDVAGVLLVELDLGDLQAQPRQPLESAAADQAEQLELGDLLRRAPLRRPHRRAPG